MSEPFDGIITTPVSLDPINLFQYSLRTTIRMLFALGFSVLFSFLYGTIAAKNSYAEQIMIPILDVLQSVPILGYMSFTIAGFLALFPGSMLGPESAVIFAIFTSQVWNMVFSFYQSLKSMPSELSETAQVFRLSMWQKFWKIEVPYGMQGLIWNAAISMSSGWFFIVAAEVIVADGHNTMRMPGIGGYISLAIAQKNIYAVVYAMIAIVVTIIMYDQCIIKPLVVWSSKFRYEMDADAQVERSWMLSFIKKATVPLLKIVNRIKVHKRLTVAIVQFFNTKNAGAIINKSPSMNSNKIKSIPVVKIWYLLLSVLTVYGFYKISLFVTNMGWIECKLVLTLGLFTAIRVLSLVLLASIIWLPISIYIGLRPQLAQKLQSVAQILAAFPANLLFPLMVLAISKMDLNPDIWLSILMIIGTQWYIVFNVVAGTLALPTEMKELSQSFGVKGILYTRKIVLPAISPYFLTGAITASGGAWNASIISEYVQWGDVFISAHGLGSYITQNTNSANLDKVILGVGVMCLFVVVINKILWQPLYDFATRKFQL